MAPTGKRVLRIVRGGDQLGEPLDLSRRRTCNIVDRRPETASDAASAKKTRTRASDSSFGGTDGWSSQAASARRPFEVRW